MNWVLLSNIQNFLHICAVLINLLFSILKHGDAGQASGYEMTRKSLLGPSHVHEQSGQRQAPWSFQPTAMGPWKKKLATQV